MFCPKCSQQQLSSEIRFCSRCGLPLNAVAELLSNNVTAPVANQAETRELAPLVSKDGLRFGAKIVFLSVFLALPAGFALSVIFDSPVPLLMAVVPFLIGLAQMLYVYFFGESLIQLPPVKQSPLFNTKAPNFSLPAAQSPYIPPGNTNPLKTSEIKQPSSVTEATTNLLKND